MRKVWHYLFVKKDPTLLGPDGKVLPRIKVLGALMVAQGLAIIILGLTELL